VPEATLWLPRVHAVAELPEAEWAAAAAFSALLLDTFPLSSPVAAHILGGARAAALLLARGNSREVQNGPRGARPVPNGPRGVRPVPNGPRGARPPRRSSHAATPEAAVREEPRGNPRGAVATTAQDYQDLAVALARRSERDSFTSTKNTPFEREAFGSERDTFTSHGARINNMPCERSETESCTSTYTITLNTVGGGPTPETL
ncbi:hypothetical protein T484DRAFT_1832955, partial [Baffinella frigidus]